MKITAKLQNKPTFVPITLNICIIIEKSEDLANLRHGFKNAELDNNELCNNDRDDLNYLSDVCRVIEEEVNKL